MLIRADARQIPLRDGCVDCVVTSPPYFGLRDYGTAAWDGGDDACDHAHMKARKDLGRLSSDDRRGVNQAPVDTWIQFRNECAKCGALRVDRQIGLEPTPAEYVDSLVTVFREVRRVLKPQGVCWLNLGDSYAANAATARGREAFESWRGSDTPTLNREHQGRSAFRGDGIKAKDLLMIPARVALALQADGWYLRSDIIWHKPNPMPESVTDRPTKAHEYLFLLSKSERYYYDAAAIAEPVSVAMLQQIDQGYDGLGLKDYEAAGVQNPSSVKARIIKNARKRKGGSDKYWAGVDSGAKNGDSCCGYGENPLTRNRRTVWSIPTMPYAGAHFATMPEALVEPCILAGSPMGGLVFDPFSGSGTVLAVAERLGRRWVGTDLNPAYHELAKVRTAQRGLRFDADANANQTL